jgi:hypothetical protein
MNESFRVGDRVEWVGQSGGPRLPKGGERGWIEGVHRFGETIYWDEAGFSTGNFIRELLVKKVGDRNEPDREKRLPGDPFDEQWNGEDEYLREDLARLHADALSTLLRILRGEVEEETMTDALAETSLITFPLSQRFQVRFGVAEHNESVRRHLRKMIEDVLGQRDELRTALASLSPAARERSDAFWFATKRIVTASRRHFSPTEIQLATSGRI